jgi:cell division septation protein DedD
MNTVNQYLCDLLYDHDCVIVPRLGGFLASYTGARLHPVHHTLEPPSRRVAFNVFLRQNDGLLASRVSQSEGITYSEALQLIEKWVTSCHKELSDGKKYLIEDIGLLYYDREQNIQFDPLTAVNYLRESFGLGPVRFLPVTADDQQKKTKHLDLISIRPSVKAASQNRSNRKSQLKKFAGGLMVAAAIVWMGLNAYLVLRNDHPVTATRTGSENINEAKVAQPDADAKVSIESTASILSVPVNVDTHRQEVQPAEPVAMNEEIKSVEPETQPVVAGNKSNYYVIAGAFRISSNAEGLVTDLQSKGFAQAQVVSANHPLTLVCYKGFASRQEALSMLDSLRKDGREGWILSK